MAEDRPGSSSGSEREFAEPAPAPVAASGPSDSPISGGALDWLPDWMLESLPYWLTTRETFLGSLLGAAVLFVFILVLAGATTWWDTNSLSNTLVRVEEVRADDTYSSWVRAHDAADRAATPPGELRRFFHTLGAIVPGSPAARRHQLRGELAFIAAQIEYRFELENSRNAYEFARTAFGPDPYDSPVAATTEIYRLLSLGDVGEALSMARFARDQFEGNHRIDRAYLEAVLAAGAAGDVVGGIESLKAHAEDWTVYDRYLLARSAIYEREYARDEALQSILTDGASEHLEARIEKMAMLTDRGAYEEAESLGRSLLDSPLLNRDDRTTPPYPIARIHIGLGDILAASGRDDADDASTESSARQQYEKAIETLPERTSVYLPLIDHLVENGDLDAAEREIEAAESTAGASEQLDIRKARLAYLRGRFDDARQRLETADDQTSLAPILEGRIRLASGDAEGAQSVLKRVPDANLRRDTARLLALVAEADLADEVSDSARQTSEELTSGESISVETRRAAAQLHLRRARYNDGDAAEASLDRVDELLEQIRERRDGRALDAYLSCERHLLARDRERAAAACETGRQKNPAYLPGMLDAVRVEMLRQSPDNAALLAAQLAGTFGDNWDVAKLRMRTLFRFHKLDRAETILADWRDADIDDVERQLFEGHLDYFRGNYADAIDHYDRAVDSTTIGDEASLYHAHAMVRLGRTDGVEDTIRTLTDSDRWRGAAWTVFGELRRHQGRGRDALENLGLADRYLDEQTDPRWRISQMQTQRALTWRDRRGWNDSRVVRYLERARREGDPESPETLYPYALYHLHVRGDDNDPARAVEYLEKVVAIQPHRCGAIDALADAYDETGDWRGKKDMEDLYAENCES